ncbi:hypothetical protein BOTNAR_0254g00060 [Botryotinia narcissicola]|uniref:Uncharacterized protein n=1 Tax=Botryotinia narcissicola TaxID=278944 RepID=A0A4Z1I6H3_9HELO|nr:hypothetical protein BOTNAR_0254g00060 [Botryotinia narcissicola]
MIPEPIKTHSACHSLPIVKVSHVNKVEIEALAIEPDVIVDSKLTPYRMNNTNGKKYRLPSWHVSLGLIGNGLEEEARTYFAGPGAT